MRTSTPLCLCLAAFMHVFSSVQGGYVGIINGTVVKPHSRPYMVSVQKGMEHICGGFLVSASFVMTAAHCNSGVNLTIVVGEHDITNNKIGTRIPVKDYFSNPEYNPETLQNDIALLQLGEIAKKSNSVDWIPLPEKDKDVAAKSVCSVAGWGATKTNGLANNLLLQTDVVIMKRDKCKKSWQKPYFSAKNICTKVGAGFCQGDSGGPLVCNNKAEGIVSFNERDNCDKPTKPNVYTKISSFLPWIKTILKRVKH